MDSKPNVRTFQFKIGHFNTSMLLTVLFEASSTHQFNKPRCKLLQNTTEIHVSVKGLMVLQYFICTRQLSKATVHETIKHLMIGHFNTLSFSQSREAQSSNHHTEGQNTKADLSLP